MRKALESILLSVALSWTPAALSHESTMTVFPLEVIEHPNGSEATAQVLVTWSDGISEVIHVYLTENSFSLHGSNRVPAIGNFGYAYEPWDGGWGEGPPTMIQSLDGNKKSALCNALADEFGTQGAAGGLLPIGLCVAGWLAVRGLQHLDCRGSGGVEEITTPMCGLFGSSTTRCHEPPPSEPPAPDQSFWSWYAANQFPHLLQIPQYDVQLVIDLP